MAGIGTGEPEEEEKTRLAKKKRELTAFSIWQLKGKPVSF